VRAGDIIILNNEAYWSILTRRISKLARRLLPPQLPAMAHKRFLLGRALKRLRRSYSKGITSVNVRASEKRATADAMRLFFKDPVFAPLKRKTLAPGGPNIGKEDIFLSDVARFETSPTPKYGQNKVRFKKKLRRMASVLNNSREEDGKFFYRFHNAVYVIRAPNSAHELFSEGKRRFSPYYNPRVIQFFLSHRFWH